MRAIALLCVISSSSFSMDDGGHRAPRGLVDWLCSIVGFACSGGLDAVRSEQREWGNEVRTFDAKTRAEKVLFQCTSCRSPLPLERSKGTAVATPDGILVVKGASRRELRVPGMVQLVAVVPGAPSSVLALREHPSDGGSDFDVVTVDLADGGLVVHGQVAPQEVDIRPGQVSDAGVVFAKKGGDLTLSPGIDRRTPRLLLQPGDQRGLPARRFDPIWLDDTVMYSARVVQ